MTVTTKPDPSLLEQIVLDRGAHPTRDAGMCVLEAAAYFAGRPHTDNPPCVSPVIGAFLRSWNDALDDETRNRLLKPCVLKVIGTVADKATEQRRSWMALDWYCRVSAPVWLRLAGLVAEAEAIEATSPIVDTASAKRAQPALNTAREAAYKAWNAARDTAGAAAWAAAGAAAWAADGATAGTAAWVAAWNAAGAAAWDAAGAAAWGAAWDAAGAAAWDAARDAAGAAAWDAARDAAGAKLRPTVENLQKAALELLDRLIVEGRGPNGS